MKYKNKRTNAKLSVHFIAKKLGISDKTYREVEANKRALEGKLLDKFCEIVDSKDGEYKLEMEVEMTNANNWYNELSVEELNNIKEKFNVNLKDISEVLGIHSSTISRLLNKERSNKFNANKDHVYALYDYFNNGINKKYTTIEKKIIEHYDEDKDYSDYCTVELPDMEPWEEGLMPEHEKDDFKEDIEVFDNNYVNELLYRIDMLENQIRRYEILIDALGDK